MEKSVLETNEMYTIDDLKARKEEAEGLEKINEQVTAELEKIISKDENEIGEQNYERQYSRKKFSRKLYAIRVGNYSSKQTKETVTEETDNNYSFKSYIKRTESEGTKLLDLQNRYRKGEIADDDLTQEQINSLCMLYDKQIEDLKRTIEAKKQQISKYKKIDKQRVEEKHE